MQKRIKCIAIVVGLILLIPLFGNLFIDGWNWSIGGFVFAFVVLFITGLAVDFTVKKLTNPVYRVVAITLIVLLLILVWIEIVTDAVSKIILSFF